MSGWHDQTDKAADVNHAIKLIAWSLVAGSNPAAGCFDFRPERSHQPPPPLPTSY